MRLDLPQPLGPSRPVMWPRGTAAVRSCTTQRPPRSTATSRSAIAAVVATRRTLRASAAVGGLVNPDRSLAAVAQQADSLDRAPADRHHGGGEGSDDGED